MCHDLGLRRTVPVTFGEAGVHTLELSILIGLEEPLDLPRGPADDLGNGDNHTVAVGRLAPTTQPNQNKVLFYH